MLVLVNFKSESKPFRVMSLDLFVYSFCTRIQKLQQNKPDFLKIFAMLSAALRAGW